mgnify:CR=1 FL=1|tara:strand:+ start:536 stop:856 length:321 start_codon:yes stop_codon:yes gene_type:complete
MKRYSITTEIKAKNLISALAPIDSEIEWSELTGTEKTHGIMIWGFEDKVTPILDEDEQPTFDKDGMPLVNVIKGTTYNVDVVWKGEQPTEWEQYEINPLTPSHTIL